MSDIVWHQRKIKREDHERLKGQRGLCVWFTGLSGAGKSTIANALEVRLHQEGIHTYLMDGDNLRHGLNRDLGFDEASREENVRRVAHVAQLLVDAGVIAIAALISPFERDRKLARSIFDDASFIEVFVDCPIDVCIERDPKGLYAKAKSGMIKEFTGVSSPYEEPLSSEITVNTSEMSVGDCVERILDTIRPYLRRDLRESKQDSSFA